MGSFHQVRSMSRMYGMKKIGLRCPTSLWFSVLPAISSFIVVIKSVIIFYCSSFEHRHGARSLRSLT